MRIDRQTFLHALEGVRPGLSPKAVLEQSDCFAFLDGQIITYNEEIYCCAPTTLPSEFNGAVRAKTLMASLGRMHEDELEVSLKDGHLAFKGKSKERGVKLEPEILMPVDGVEKPGKWKRLEAGYCEALQMVQECAGNDVERFVTTCVNIAPTHVEAFDNQQMMRYQINTRIETASFVKKTSVAHIARMEATKFSESEAWLHFKNDSGVVMSCRRFVEEYMDLSEELEVTGKRIVLPKGLADAAKAAEDFTSDDKENNYLTLSVKEGRLRVRGDGSNGYSVDVMKAKYEGPPMEFMIAPKLLAQVVSRYSEAKLAERRLFVTGDDWVYVTKLRDPKAGKD